MGQKWLGVGVTGLDILTATKKYVHCLACQGPYYQADYPRPSGSYALHQGCSEGPQPHTPIIAPHNRLSRQTEPSQLTTHTACLGHSQATKR